MSETITHFPREVRFVREPFDEIAPRGAEYLVKGLLPAQGLGFIGGPSGSFKSFLATDWGLSLAAALPILGRPSRACGVVYVAAEAPNGVRKRVAAWRLARSRAGLPFELVSQAPNLNSSGDIAELAAELRIAADEMANKSVRLGLVVIDTLAASMPGVDESSGKDMSAVIANLAGLGSVVGAFVLVVSHTGKDETRGLRGWSGQFAGADFVVMLSREEGATLAVGKVAKLKDGEAGQRFALCLDPVTLGKDEEGDEISSAVVAYEIPPDAGKRPGPRKLNAAEKVLLDAVAYVTNHGQTHPLRADLVGVRRGTKAVAWADVRARAIEAGFSDPAIKSDSVRRRFARAREGLVAAGKVRVEGESLWLL